MAQPQDRFWMLFFGTTASVVFFGMVVLAVFVARPYSTVPTLPHDSVNEPFAYAQSAGTISPSDVFYRESIPLGFGNVSWNTTIDWRSQTHYIEGSYAARAEFLGEWSGIGLEGPAGTSTAAYRGISLSVYAEPGLPDLYLELYGAKEESLGRQSLGWYFPDSKFKTGEWQTITIPLGNFGPGVTRGFAVLAPQKGIAYIDNVHLVRDAAPRAAWTPVPEVAGTSTDNSLNAAFGRVSSFPLPYTLPLTPESLVLWHVYEGQFAVTSDALMVGPLLRGGSTHAVFLPGLSWINYRVDTVVDWGPAVSFSLVARIKDETSYVTCGFSTYGSLVQIYSTQNGTSELVAESPFLGVPALEAWSKIPLSIEVKGNRVNCYVRGVRVLSATPKNMPLYGTAGIEVWDTNPMQQPHKVRSFTVTPL